jgi:hypothetical protein
LKERFCGTGLGGSRWLSGLRRIEAVLQEIKRTTIAVVTTMIFRASSEDS